MTSPDINTIIAYEQGELDDRGTILLFAELVETGLAWTLQGSYGRTAAALIEQGIITRTGEVLIDISWLDEEEE